MGGEPILADSLFEKKPSLQQPVVVLFPASGSSFSGCFSPSQKAVCTTPVKVGCR